MSNNSSKTRYPGVLIEVVNLMSLQVCMLLVMLVSSLLSLTQVRSDLVYGKLNI